MSGRPSVRRARTDTGDLADGWVLTRPPFGFSSYSTVSRHPSWRSAHKALESGPASAAALIQIGPS